MAWDGTGTPIGTGDTYGITLANIEAQIAAIMGWSTGDATQLSAIDRAITAVGQAVCTWEGRNWWFLRTSDDFDTVATEASYNLKTVNAASMKDLLAPTHIYYGTTALGYLPYDQYVHKSRTFTGMGTPDTYSLAGDIVIYLSPTPGDTYTILVDYVKRHSTITSAGSADTDLLIPGEFHYSLYVDGSLWLLRNETVTPASLAQCPEFVDSIYRLQASSPDSYQDGLVGPLPDGKDIIIIGDIP